MLGEGGGYVSRTLKTLTKGPSEGNTFDKRNTLDPNLMKGRGRATGDDLIDAQMQLAAQTWYRHSTFLNLKSRLYCIMTIRGNDKRWGGG